jgi:hypothetical protein
MGNGLLLGESQYSEAIYIIKPFWQVVTEEFAVLGLALAGEKVFASPAVRGCL